MNSSRNWAAAAPAAPVVRPRWRVEATAPVAVTSAKPVALQPAQTVGFRLGFHLFCLLIFVVIGRPNDYFLFLVPLRLALVFTVLTVVVTFAQRPNTVRSAFAAKETKLYLLWYAAMIAGIPFAAYRPAAFEDVLLKYIVNIVFFLLFVIHVDSVPKLKRVGAILVASIALYNIFAFQSGQFVSGRYTTASGMFDANDVAFIEVSLLGFALWVLVGRFAMTLKIVALLTVLSSVLLTLFTASRGGLLGLATFLLLFLGLRVSKVSKSFKMVLLGAMIVGAIGNIDKINLERYQTLGSIEEDYNFAEGGRVDIWTRGITLFFENPLTGVGVSGFAKSIGEQRREEGVTAKWVSPHSAYIQVLTETGMVGATAFLLLIITSARTFNRLRRTPPESLPELGALPGLLLVGFGAQLVSASFLSQAYSMFFTLAFAFSAALNCAAALPKPATDLRAQPSPSRPHPDRRY